MSFSKTLSISECIRKNLHRFFMQLRANVLMRFSFWQFKFLITFSHHILRFYQSFAIWLINCYVSGALIVNHVIKINLNDFKFTFLYDVNFITASAFSDNKCASWSKFLNFHDIFQSCYISCGPTFNIRSLPQKPGHLQIVCNFNFF